MSILKLKFTVSKQVSRSSLDKAWKILSDVKNMPKYWRGHREIEIVNNNDNSYLVRIRFAFNGPNNKGLARIIIDSGRRRVVINYLEGPIRGYVVNYVGDESIISQWEVKITPLFLIMKPWIKKHFIEGTSNALKRIINDAETTE